LTSFVASLERSLQRKVIIYTNPTCPWCHRAKEYLSQKGISYTEHDLLDEGDITIVIMREYGKDMARKVIQAGGQLGAPVITVNSEVVVGFNKNLLDKLLS